MADTEYPLFFGYVRAIEPHPELDQRTTVVHCVDLFYFLNRERPVIGQTANITTGEAIGLILDACGFTDLSMRSLGEGDDLALWPADDLPADGSRTALELIAELLTAEQGVFFIDGAGIATYIDRHTLHVPQDADHNLESVFAYIEQGPDLDLVRNRARVTRTGGVEQEVSNETSVAMYGTSDHDPVESPYLADDNTAQSLAGHLVEHHGMPRDPVWRLEVDATAGPLVLEAMLHADIASHVTVQELVSGTVGLHHIESLEMSFDATQHTGAWALSKTMSAAGAPFRIGISVLDGPDVFTY